jgi:hypothetical protein
LPNRVVIFDFLAKTLKILRQQFGNSLSLFGNFGKTSLHRVKNQRGSALGIVVSRQVGG